MGLCKLFVAAWTWHICSANPVSPQCHVLWRLLLAASWSCACVCSLPGELPYQQGGRAARSGFHNKGFLLWSGSPAVHGRDSEEDCKEEMIWLTGRGSMRCPDLLPPLPCAYPPAPSWQSGCCFHSPDLAPPAGAHWYQQRSSGSRSTTQNMPQ